MTLGAIELYLYLTDFESSMPYNNSPGFSQVLSVSGVRLDSLRERLPYPEMYPLSAAFRSPPKLISAHIIAIQYKISLVFLIVDLRVSLASIGDRLDKLSRVVAVDMNCFYSTVYLLCCVRTALTLCRFKRGLLVQSTLLITRGRLPLELRHCSV